jgi:hypothetical protein
VQTEEHRLKEGERQLTIRTGPLRLSRGVYYLKVENDLRREVLKLLVE